jgi:hypothetical protein
MLLLEAPAALIEYIRRPNIKRALSTLKESVAEHVQDEFPHHHYCKNRTIGCSPQIRVVARVAVHFLFSPACPIVKMFSLHSVLGILDA